MLADWLGLPKQLEVVLIITAGITCLAFDSSLFYMKSNLEEIWNYVYHSNLQEYYMETVLKYILTGVIFVRTFTTHIFLALYVVMLWPAIFADRPNLMVPWLMIGSVRYVAVNLITLVIGSYACISQKGHHPICFDYFVSQVIEHGPSLYAWLSILNYYKALQVFCSEEQKKTQLQQELALRRRKARTMGISIMNFEEKVDDGRNLLSESTLDNLIHQIESDFTTNSRSLDSLLKLKSTKETQEEIMYSDILTEEEHCASILERAMRVLNVDEKDILRAITERAHGTLRGEIDKDMNNTSDNDSSDSEHENIDGQLTQSTSINSPVAEVDNQRSTPPENEIEIGCISYTSDAPPLQGTNNDTKESKKTAEEEIKVPTTQDFLEKFAGVMQIEIKKMANFGCQASTLSRSFLSQPPEEITKKLRLSKKIIFNAW